MSTDPTWPQIPRDMPRPRPTAKDEAAAKGCAAVIMSIVFMIPLAIYEGWVLMVMWGWFVVPTFQAPGLGLWAASGLVLGISWLHATYRLADTPFEREDPLGTLFKRMAFTVLGGALTLLVGRYFYALMV